MLVLIQIRRYKTMKRFTLFVRRRVKKRLEMIAVSWMRHLGAVTNQARNSPCFLYLIGYPARRRAKKQPKQIAVSWTRHKVP